MSRLLLGACVALAVGCGPTGRFEVVHAQGSDAAVAVVRVAMTQQVTVPDNFIMRPDEFGTVAVDHPRQLLYVGSREGTLLALDMTTGEFLWELPLGGAVASSPVLVDLPREGDGGDAPVPSDSSAPKDLLLVGTDNGDEIAVDLRTREELWRYSTDGKVRRAPVVAEGVAYISNSREQVFGLDLRTGAWRWQYEQPLQPGFTVSGYAGLTYQSSSDGGRLYTGFGNGKVAALDAGSGEALWLASVAPPQGGDFADCDSTPLLDEAGGRLYVSGQQTGVYALDLEDGSQLWHFDVRAAGDLAWVAGNDLVGSSSLEGVFSLDRNGELLWRTQVDPGVLSSPLVVEDTVYVAHNESGLLALDRATGELLARIDPGSGISSAPVFDPVLQRIYATSNRGVLYGLELVDAAEPPALAVLP
ncbi:MAG: PQQ-binding-like beta-propeller repeat protein [Nannocystaceae bacterium]|nr:PQQ-binding-like beta-propeller repeat protein [Nannocystaceae bacterium]